MRLTVALVVLLAASSSLAGDRRYDLTASPLRWAAEQVTLFEHVGFDGRAREINGVFDGVGHTWNDTASSLRIPRGKTVVLYEHVDFTGATLALTGGDVVDLRAYRGPGADGTWNDVVSAIRVFDGPPPAWAFPGATGNRHFRHFRR